MRCGLGSGVPAIGFGSSIAAPPLPLGTLWTSSSRVLRSVTSASPFGRNATTERMLQAAHDDRHADAVLLGRVEHVRLVGELDRRHADLGLTLLAESASTAGSTSETVLAREENPRRLHELCARILTASANTTTCPEPESLGSSGVMRRAAIATSDGPVVTATYCLPSTAKLIG